PIADPGVTAPPLAPPRPPPQMSRQPLQRVHRRRAEQQRIPLKRADRHRILPDQARAGPRHISTVPPPAPPASPTALRAINSPRASPDNGAALPARGEHGRPGSDAARRVPQL